MARAAVTLVAFVAASVALAAAFVYSGYYDIGADAPHWPATESALATLRERSLASSSASVEIPKLDDPAEVANGARHYAEMCAGCHLSPVSRGSDTREGLYPKPPDLYQTRIEPRRAFWAIKHGIKMTGMPAWGRTHDDAAIWSIVAFLRKMPELDPEAYRKLAAPEQGPQTAPADGHSHHHH